MRTVNFKSVFDRIVRRHGRDPRKNLTSDLRDALIDHINDRVKTIWSCWRWPEWELTEERAYRTVWNLTRQFLRVGTNGKPDEMFYIPDTGYYRVTESVDIDPPVGTLPTDTDFFEPISPVDTFIEYDQACRRSIGMVLGVYSQNPRVPTGSGNGTVRFQPSERGVDLLGVGTPTVFITHKLPAPVYTMLPYVTGKTFPRGAVTFDPGTGECFQAVAATSAAPSDATFWRWIPFLDEWLPYVVDGAFADSLLEFDQGGNTEIQAKIALASAAVDRAEYALQAAVDRQVTQGYSLKWNFCKHYGNWCESQPWSGGTVSELTAACQDELGWVYPVPPLAVPGLGWEYHPEIVALLTVDGSPSLQALATISRAVGSVVMIVIVVDGTAEMQSWRVETGAANPLDLGQVAPGDYNISTNPKHWAKIG